MREEEGGRGNGVLCGGFTLLVWGGNYIFDRCGPAPLPPSNIVISSVTAHIPPSILFQPPSAPAERFAPDMRWYVDTILQLLNIAGDFVSDDIWHRVVQIVTNKEDLQKYAVSA